jgi:hypothetical protein
MAQFQSTSVTGSLTVTGQVIAQTLNVQQVTSSIVYSSGSNIFGNSLANTQQFTGSLQVSGSSHYVLGNVGVGITTPSASLHVVRANDGGSGTPAVILSTSNGANDIVRFQDGTTPVAVVKNDGSIGIGTASPAFKLDIEGTSPIARVSDPNTSGVNRGGGFRAQTNTSTGDFLSIANNANAPFNSNDGVYIMNRTSGSNLHFTTNNAGTEAERMRITSGGNIGINTASPNVRLNIAAATSGVTGFTDYFKIGSDASTFINEGGYSSLLIGTFGVYDASIATTGNDLRIYSGRSVATEDHQIMFYTGFNGAGGAAENNERMRITHNGYIRMASGTGGIQFNGDTAAANALDDYEEGTWTPTSESGGLTFSIQVARYTKVGRLVTAQCYVTMPTGGNTSAVVMGGLPFTNLANGWAPGALDVSACSRIGGVARVAQNSTTIGFIVSSGSTSLGRFEIQGNEFGNDSYIILTVTYQTS